jgi:hypothetical protein
MTTDAGSGFDNQAAARDAAANLDDIEEESRHLPGDDADAATGDDADAATGDEVAEGAGEEAQERQHVHDEVNDAF